MPLARIKNSLVFFAHIPKTGGSSVENHLRQRGKVSLYYSKAVDWSACSPQHYHAAIYETLFRPGFYDFGFTVIRNPTARIISEYQFRCFKAAKQGRDPLGPIDEWISLAFERFAKNPFYLDNHIRPQVEFLSDGFEVFRLEDGLERVCHWIDELTGLQPRYDHVWFKKSPAEKPQVSRDTIKLIEDFYAADFDLFESV